MLSAVIRPGRGSPAMLLAEQPAHQRSVHPGPLVLGADLLKPLAPTADRDRTVSRRSEPSSRPALMGDHPTPGHLIQPRDARSRHRGAKPCRRYELLGRISLLSPEYLLSVERRPFHPDYAGSLSPAFASARAIALAVKLPYTFTLRVRLPTALREPLDSSVTLLEEAAPAK